MKKISIVLFMVFVVTIWSTINYESTIKDMDVYPSVESENIVQIEENFVDVWTTANVGNYGWNTKITVVYIDDNWAKVKDTDYYIERNYLSESPFQFVNRDAPPDNSIKCYMDYRCITSKSSNQYRLQHTLAYTGDNGLRMVNGRYCVALGSYYTTTIGQYVDIELENGIVVQGILADCKADIHTDSTNRMNPNGCVLEFVVETESLDDTARIMGDISYVNGWDSKVVNVKVYDKVEVF